MKKYIPILISSAVLASIFLSTTPVASAQNQLWQTIVGKPEPAEILVDNTDGGGGDGGGSGSGGSNTMVTCPSKNYRSCLINQFNMTIKGNPREKDYKNAYQGLRHMSAYPRLYKALKRGSGTFYFLPQYNTCGDSPYWCRTAAPGAYAFVDIYGNLHVFRAALEGNMNYFMVHEGAHVADDNMGRVKDYLHLNAYQNNKDRDCYDNYKVIKTYPTLSLRGSGISLESAKNESFAEAVTNTILCKPGQLCGFNGGTSTKINSWQNKCSWINKYLLKEMNG